MEVQPINIQLNTSTDDESESETSLLKDASMSSTPKSHHPTPPGFAVNLFYRTYPENSNLTPTSAPFTPAMEGEQHPRQIIYTQCPNTNTTNTNQMPSEEVTTGKVQQENHNTYYGMDVPESEGLNSNDCAPYVVQQYPYVDYYNQPPTMETFTPEVMGSESTVSMTTGTVYEQRTCHGHYPEQSNSGIALSSNVSPIPGENDIGEPALQYEAMVYPSLMVSSAGLLTVFLKYDIAVELTLDCAIRLVNNRHRAVVATNNYGNASCIHHPAAKIYQEGSVTEAELFYDRRAKLSSDRALFSCAHSCFQLSDNQMRCALPDFSEISNDMSVTILFSSSGYGPHLTKRFEDLVSKATYRYYKDGGISVWIGDVKIQQNKQGDVTVISNRKFLRTSSNYGTMYIETPFLQASVEMNWNVQIQRGDYHVQATLAGMVVSDGTKECGFDQYQQVFVQSVQTRKQPSRRNGMSVVDSNRGNRYENNRYVYNRYQNYCTLNYNNNNYAPRCYSGRSRHGYARNRGRVSSDSSSHSFHNSSEDVSQDTESY